MEKTVIDEQLLLMPQRFQKQYAVDASKCVSKWERAKLSHCIDSSDSFWSITIVLLYSFFTYKTNKKETNDLNIPWLFKGRDQFPRAQHLWI